VPHRFHIVDVFAEAPRAGNPLAVVRDAAGLSGEAMQAIAREFGFSETSFLVSDPRATEAGVRTRIFTPAREIPFAGHPTLGTAWVIREHLAGRPVDSVTLELGVGRVPVAFEREEGAAGTAGAPGAELAWLAAPPIRLGAVLAPERLAASLGIEARELDPRLPAQHVLAGIEFVFVPLRSLDALRRSHLDLRAFAPLASEGLPSNAYLFCRETVEPSNDLHARLFFAAPGVREDPATGSAAACLGAYLLAHRAFEGGDLRLRIEQGHEMGRPSLLRLRARTTPDGPRIRVGGRVVEAARGELL
jgi:trans-2,3-dihydro-3-hydroxyanthranilate isomerase